MKPKTVILGLDGLSYPLLEYFTERGVMPHLKKLLEKSVYGPMTSTWPEISPVAWTTFFTGRNPAEHGIFGFTEFEPQSYNLRFNSSGRVQVPALWDWLGLKGRNSIVLNVPMTYPAVALSGAMISGFVAPGMDRAGFPSWVVEYMKKSGYKLEADFEMVHLSRESFLADIFETLSKRDKLLDIFWPREWDLFFLVITSTDRMNHFFLSEFEENGPIYERFCEFYQEVDKTVGRVHDLFNALAPVDSLADPIAAPIADPLADPADSGEPDEHLLLLLSDHGFIGLKAEFHLNRWLVAHGFQAGGANGAPGLSPDSKAFALDPTRIYINSAARFSQGRLSNSETGALINEIRAGLSEEEAVKDVYLPHQIYDRGDISKAPDLIVHPAHRYEFKAKFNEGPIYSTSPLKGTHTHDNAFYLIHSSGKKMKPPKINSIHDLAGFVFERSGITAIK